VSDKHRKVVGIDVGVGQRFGRLTVLQAGPSSHSGRRWICQCDCGKSSIPFGFALKDGSTSSCGCLNKELMDARRFRHGAARGRGPTYRAWEAMRGRCKDPKHTSFKNYGALGVGVCSRWDDFTLFLEDLGEKPGSQYTLGRKNNDLGYEPGNCAWETRIEQNNNTSRNHFLEFAGKRQTVAQWARELGVVARLLHKRIQMGWSTHRVLTEPRNERFAR